MSAINDAQRRQNQASQPSANTWLLANAGSGKTRVLTDRVARLLLDGVDPQHILCLTYTRAAASEMQNRLFEKLGAWAMMPDVDLGAELRGLGEIGPFDFARARRLFATAIEAPGGLKIQTIHSFCGAVLRRFPLEARVAPGFAELDETGASEIARSVLTDMASGPDAALIAGLLDAGLTSDLADLSGRILGQRPAFAPVAEDALLALCDHDTAWTPDRILTEAAPARAAAAIAALVALLETGTRTDQGQAAKLSGIDLADPTLSDLATLEAIFLTGSGAADPFASKAGKYPKKAFRATLAGHTDALDALMDRIAAVRPRRLSCLAHARSRALRDFATALIDRYEDAKARLGVLDYDDLILKTLALLSDPILSQWVLYRLDGGIDHILIDEAQDTSPVQWRLIGKLAEDMAAGDSGRARSLFVVGDKKQSIYSFQGADPREFDRMRDDFRARMVGAAGLMDLQLEYSFRSSAAILGVVDKTLRALPDAGLSGEADHIAFKSEKPGRVDLWPLVPRTENAEPDHWYDPVDRTSDTHQTHVLARKITEAIRGMIGREVIEDKEGARRPVRAGDIMILLQSRTANAELFYSIIAALKEAGLPVAGADRLKLAAELAVRDLVALLSFLSLPEDDLSLAAALRSPLFGVTEAQLFDLATGRGEAYLWETLRNRSGAFAPAIEMLTDLRDQTDFLRPYELVERMLTRHGGRERLIARLGTEAEDGIDEFLSQALAYETAHTPSLPGFLAWYQRTDVTVKRQSDSAGDRIRVMTVHGAKGLEAPVVFLPGAGAVDRPKPVPFIVSQSGTALAPVRAQDAPPQLRAEIDAARTLRAQENARLLYVAMTRAESWLIVCGTEPYQGSDHWHAAIGRGLEAAGAAPLTCDDGDGLRFSHGVWPDAASADDGPDAPAPDLPDWVRRAPPAPVPAAQRIAPTALGGAKALPGEGDTTEVALDRGTMIHRLLEHLAQSPPEARNTVASAVFAAAGLPPDPAMIDEALAVLNDPALAALFTDTALHEVEIVADLPHGLPPAGGTIDLLIVEDDHVLAVDFKSNRQVPDSADKVPEGILRQMGAYAHALSQTFPDRRIDTAILWTATPALMPLPHEIVRDALLRAATS